MSAGVTTSAATTASAPIPLTTTFVPPSTCISDFWLVSSSSKTWMNLGPAHTAECVPSGWDVSSYFSPGLCPTGYRIAASNIVIDGTITETAATCCPTIGIQTYSTRTTYTPGWTELEVCTWEPGKSTEIEFAYTWTDTAGSTSSTSSSLSSPGHINGYGISIRWQSTDFTTPAATSASTTSSGDSPATATSSTTSPTSTSSSSSSGLSTGAKAGIGVGVAAGAVLAIFLLLFFLRRRKGNASSANQQAYQSPDQAYRVQRLNELPATRTGAFMTEQVELPASGRDAKAELPSEFPIAELDGGGRH
ncbi:hypothetical protein AtubIFM56815_004138 [Aspergillus tubingensis]|uniref:Mid2 domain-containing protein n=2 Tax=Aspergillus tubingensis TaxID=5068 RepID=A0A1L9NEV7_ASPTC|nr:beta-ketoacyl synthase, N-terminal domain family protein [Aspergillus tubingensis]OJI87791.1 hypothetical protein ASPTUDRAFT_196790 [Aspergillus tubingensis CBS 134.48]GFN21565.1 beta-ketoacyl synthase, N-terminal domain family protein [Aspergillus tubingensis]GLA63800.1 hypothetical protein AtubIFM54640_004956 [Aspergillus tubingensis]GLA89650.1 hypothetical protein AtubIFM56815_004138 [Aspergillus tubingensis]